jgi:SAM-dependent methyltransferase
MTTTTSDTTIASIQRYWNERAAQNADNPAATTDDIHLRDLEMRTLTRALRDLRLPHGARVLDAGCGDGFTTIRLAEAFPNLTFVGFDYAPAMIDNARRSVEKEPSIARRVKFHVGDVTAITAESIAGPCDAVITCRCLINLPEAETQRDAFERLAGCLKPAATYLAIENFHEGQNALNDARATIGLPAIPLRWHNRFLTEAEFIDLSREWFVLHRFDDFASAYYFATRVVYSKMCQMRGEQPDYDHDIHRLAVDLPPLPAGRFSPVRLAILKRR